MRNGLNEPREDFIGTRVKKPTSQLTQEKAIPTRNPFMMYVVVILCLQFCHNMTL